ncbi:hypothetical protein [Sphingobacterium rhinopitheci]|uniref:hypothetical protein n=1 Tax=Sphingobacterium rhinopitheci TaxID=2781960 RepID=UPI001F5183C4|nr:hypothetical protein [Sphingobacterium rhinopitheci]MCI0920669.1 hypothetical protein [Sphingobacterium rhinopitheci]
MNNTIIKSILIGSAVAIGIMYSCSKNDNPTIVTEQEDDGADNQERRFITFTAAIPNDATPPVPGDGGTLAFALTEEEARDPSMTIDIFTNGYSLRSQRTARVQASVNGNYLYNIQYTGVDGGVFNKYTVNGGNKYEDTGQQLNTFSILGASPRWVKSVEGIGIGVSMAGAMSPIDPDRAEAGTQTYQYVRGTASVAVLDLNDPKLINSTVFEFPFTEEEKNEGYTVNRIDVPVLNAARNKVFIGCNITKVDPEKPLVRRVNAQTNAVSWSWVSDNENIKGSVTLVLDYPSLANPTLIWSTQSRFGNSSYRTMTQYVGTDGNIYQATGANITSYPHILRIDRNTDTYDNSYLFDLAAALNITTGRVGIKAWTYIRDGQAVAIYDIDGRGGYIALLDLNAKTARRISNQYEATLDFVQYQNIGVVGDFAYIPLTPSGVDGQIYVVNWKDGSVVLGARLKNQSGSYYIGSY